MHFVFPIQKGTTAPEDFISNSKTTNVDKIKALKTLLNWRPANKEELLLQTLTETTSVLLILTSPAL